MKRAEAKALGLKHYMPERPCPSGHLARRFVSNGGCDECLKAHNRRYQSAHRDELMPKKRAWARQNPEKNRAQSRQWQVDNRAIATAMQKASKAKKPEHYAALWRAYAAKRRAALLQRTPPWADLEEIRRFYFACPSGMEVDHVVPLQGANVCGLHVQNNLQYLTKSENSRKGARWE